MSAEEELSQLRTMWNRSEFENLDAESKLLYLYMRLNPLADMRETQVTAAVLGVGTEVVRRSLQELSTTRLVTITIPADPDCALCGDVMDVPGGYCPECGLTGPEE